MKIRLPRLPNILQRQADKLGASQALGSAWAWLADLRDPLTAVGVEPFGVDRQELRQVLISSPLNVLQLKALAKECEMAAATKMEG